MKDERFTENSLAQAVLAGELPLYLVDAWESENFPPSIRVDAWKCMRLRGKQRTLFWAGFILTPLLPFLFVWWWADVPLGSTVEQISLDMAHENLIGWIILITLICTIIYLLGTMGGITFSIFSPSYSVRMNKFWFFVAGHLSDLGLRFTDLSQMSFEASAKKADEILIALAMKVQEIEAAEAMFPNLSSFLSSEKAKSKRQIESLFERFKSLGLVRMDEDGGYGWHFAQAADRLPNEELRLSPS